MAEFGEGIPSSYVDNFKTFEQHYPTVDDRYRAAVDIAGGREELPEEEHRGRNLLIMHWAEEREDLLAVACNLYDLRSRVYNGRHAPFIVVRSGSVADVLSKDNERLKDGVEIEFGVVYDAELRHLVRGNRGRLGNSYHGVAPPLLSFEIGVSALRRARLEVDAEGVASFDDEVKEVGVITAYEGTVPLAHDERAYHRKKRLFPREFIFGQTCRPFMRTLVRKTVDSKSLARDHRIHYLVT